MIYLRTRKHIPVTVRLVQLAHEKTLPGETAPLGGECRFRKDNYMHEWPVEAFSLSELLWSPTSLVIDLTKAVACGS